MRKISRCLKAYQAVISLSILLFSLNAFAKDYYTHHETGWHWYQDPPPAKITTQNLPSAVTQMQVIKQRIAAALDQALLQPTPQNVGQYIQLQNQWSNQAGRFSEVWQSVLLQHPELNYSLLHPTNQLGRQVYLDNYRGQETLAIQKLFQHSGLFFFYRSTCPYCQRFAPIVKDFTERYHITVIPITTNGVSLPEFPQSRVDNGQAAKFHISVEPALFTVDPYTHQAIPVAYGLLSEDELKSRILQIARHFQGDAP